MPVLLCFNELCCQSTAPRWEVDTAMDEFVAMLVKIRNWRRDTSLVSDVPLKGLELTSGYYFDEWRRQSANIEKWRRIRGLQNRAPFGAVLARELSDGTQYLHAGREGKALAAAHLLGGIMVSIKTDIAWDEYLVRADRFMVVEAEDGEPVLREDTIEVPHAACCDHTDRHEDQIKQSGLTDLTHGCEIWAARANLYPALRFLPRVEEDLIGLPATWVIPAARELLRINEAIAVWDSSVSQKPLWRSDVTVESESRIKEGLVSFEDLDGEIRAFSLHGRFTPRPGRVHFRLLPAEGAALIGYVGRKRGV